MIDFIREAAGVVPSKRQKDWFELESYAFVHFGMNAFTDREWGTGKEPEEIFDPVDLDCDQWVAAIKSAGMKGMVLTAKHHDGFCLWPSKFTDHCVKNSPFKRDIVKEASEACRRGGIKFGFYLSPWDRNSALYGTDAYNDYFCNQLTELLTQYGDIFYVWFDNACGEGPNGKKQRYDFPRYIRLIRELQPNAVIFNDFGPDVRWCGNEAGTTRKAEWAVIPSELTFYGDVQTGPGPFAERGSLSYLYSTSEFLGDMNQILYTKGLTFTPAEINMSIRPGWFFHQNEDPHPLERLYRTYLNSVGGNCCFHLNIPPNSRGLFDERDVRRLQELGDLIRKELSDPLKCTIRKSEESTDMQPRYIIELDQTETRTPKYVVLQEDLDFGQRVETFRVLSNAEEGWKYPVYQGTTIGHKKICPLMDPFAEQNPLTKTFEDCGRTLTVFVTAARDEVHLRSIQVY